MTTVSVRLATREMEALLYLISYHHARQKSHVLRKLIRQAAAAAGYGQVAARPARRRG